MNHCKNLLIIDDNSEITDMLCRYLKLVNYEVTVSNDGRNGLNLIKSGLYDKILLDLSMPEFSGIDVLDDLNKIAKIDISNIILFTASSIIPDELDRLMKMGVNSCIRKPVRMKELIQILES